MSRLVRLQETDLAPTIPGVGEAALFESDSPIRASTTALVEGVLLQVDFEGADALAKKDQVIALLKSAAAGRRRSMPPGPMSSTMA